MRMLSALLCATVVAALCSTPLHAQNPDDEQLRSRLEQTLTDVDFEDVALSKVIDWFRTEFDLNIFVHEPDLEANGADLSTPITLELKRVPIATALRLALRGAGDQPPTFTIEEGVVVISSGTATVVPRIMQIYEVSDLVSSGLAQRRMLNTPLLRLRLTGDEAEGAETDSRGSCFGSGGRADTSARYTFERLDDVIELIRNVVAPDTWMMNGGFGSINRQGGRLVVHNTRAVHEELADLLALLRSDLPPSIDLHATFVRAPAGTLGALRGQLADTWPRIPTPAATRLEADLAGKGLILFQTTTTGPSGQSQFLSSLTQREYIAGVQPVVASGAVGYAPTVEPANAGLELAVLPVVTPDRQAIVLDVSLAVIADQGITNEAFFGGEWGESLSVQLRSANLRTVLSTIRLDAGQAVLLVLPPPGPSAPEDDPKPEAFVLLRPTVRP